MRSNVSIMRQLMSILEGLSIDNDAVKIEIEEDSVTIRGERHHYRAATVTMRNGDHITVRDDSSFDATNSNWDSIPLLSAGKT